MTKNALPLSLGEVAEQSEDGEGKPGRDALSVTCGDSSPGGRAKGVTLKSNTQAGTVFPPLLFFRLQPENDRLLKNGCGGGKFFL